MPRVGKEKKVPTAQQEKAHNDYLQLREKIVRNEIGKIRKMNISEVLTRSRVPKRDETYVSKPNDPISVSRTLNQSFNVHEGFAGEKTPGELWARQIMERERLKRLYDAQLNRNPIFHQIKRGKLGIDLYLIIFAVTAGLALPLYFFNRMQQNRRKVIQARGLDPDMIQYLDEDSSLNIDDVSHQSYHYMNLDRQDSVRKQLNNLETYKKLERDLQEM